MIPEVSSLGVRSPAAGMTEARMQQVVGGIPLKVFAPAISPQYGLDTALSDVRLAVRALSEEDLRHALSSIMSADEQIYSERLVHAKRPMGSTPGLGTYPFHADWASPVAQQLAFAHFGPEGYMQACARLWDCSRLKGLPAGLGMLAENIVHDHLVSGCTLKGVRLEEGGAPSSQPERHRFHFRTAVRHWFSSLSDLQACCLGKNKEQLCHMYLQPIQGNYPAIDGLSFALEGKRQLVLRLIQITTAKELHPLEPMTIQRLLLALGYKPLSTNNEFVVEVLVLLKPTGFEKGLVGTRTCKYLGGSGFQIPAVVQHPSGPV